MYSDPVILFLRDNETARPDNRGHLAGVRDCQTGPREIANLRENQLSLTRNAIISQWPKTFPPCLCAIDSSLSWLSNGFGFVDSGGLDEQQDSLAWRGSNNLVRFVNFRKNRSPWIALNGQLGAWHSHFYTSFDYEFTLYKLLTVQGPCMMPVSKFQSDQEFTAGGATGAVTCRSLD